MAVHRVASSLEKAYYGRTVLVTGDTGFKGSWLSIWLHSLGARVVGLALPPRNDQDNYVVCGLNRKNEHIDGDIRDIETVRRVMADHEPSVVFHLAAQALVLDSYKDPLGTFQTNILGTANVLEAIRGCPGVRAAVMVASDKCYENREWVHGYRESDALGGRDPYSASKGASEIVASSYQRSFFSAGKAASIASVRAGNVMGGGDWAPNRIVPDCMRALRRKRPIVVRNPDAVRPWQHVLEPLHGYLKLGAELLRSGKKYSGAWNFGPSHKNQVTVRRLVETVLRCWGFGSYTVRRAGGQKEACLLALDISKAANLLGWSPALNFETTVRFTVEEYRFPGKGTEDFLAQRTRQIERYMELRASVDGGGV
jgi:CDP-glucose 4,6-dehydratase